MWMLSHQSEKIYTARLASPWVKWPLDNPKTGRTHSDAMAVAEDSNCLHSLQPVTNRQIKLAWRAREKRERFSKFAYANHVRLVFENTWKSTWKYDKKHRKNGWDANWGASRARLPHLQQLSQLWDTSKRSPGGLQEVLGRAWNGSTQFQPKKGDRSSASWTSLEQSLGSLAHFWDCICSL